VTSGSVEHGQDRVEGAAGEHFTRPPVHRDLLTVDLEHFDHAAAGGDRDHRVAVVRAGQGQPIGVGVRIVDVDVADFDGRARGDQGGARLRQPFVVGVPAEQSAEKAHVGALALVGRRERPVGVELGEKVRDLAVHQVAAQSADAQGGRAVRAGSASHHRSDHVVEDADG
jgi:hypothetical protein